MKYAIYSVRDILNGFGALMCDHNDKTAIRNFCAAFRSAAGVDSRDYDLFRIGTFDTETGMIVPESSPALIFRGIDLIKNEVTSDE